MTGSPGPATSHGEELELLLNLATQLAQQAAELQLDALGRARDDVETKSSGTDLVTDVDRACERLIVNGITAARAHDAILGEEGTDRVGSTGVRWIIDPLDGTTNFVYGHPGFGVSVAIEINGRVETGVVVDTMAGDVFSAQRGAGARRNGRVITSSRCTSLPEALIATGFSYQAARRAKQATALVDILPAVRDVRRMGAAAVDLCSVACARIDGYYEVGLAPWDHSAGALIASESGAVVTDLNGGAPSVHGVVAATPGIAEELRVLLLRAGVAEHTGLEHR